MADNTDQAVEPLEEDHALWQTDRIELTTVGIDVGSATSQMMFSKIHLRRMGRRLSSRYAIVERTVTYRSPVHLTPYRSSDYIDEMALRSLLDNDYAAAGLLPDDIDTGAVILTGEAIRRRNARAVADVIGVQGGKFVCVTAGHHMESMLAAHGAGAVGLSRDRSIRVLNIDIGGGTTKFALVERGTVTRTAALHVGGRLIAFDEAGRIVRLEPAGRRIAAECGYDWRIGDSAEPSDLRRLGQRMADLVLEAVTQTANHSSITGVWLTEPLGDTGPIDAVTISGGVSEYVYDPGTSYRGDLGEQFGAALRQREAKLPAPLCASRARILATVIGASQYTVQVSGNTIYISDAGVLPLRNLRVIRPHLDWPTALDGGAIAEAIKAHFKALDIVEGDGDIALAFAWSGAPSFSRISAFAEGVRMAMPHTLAKGMPLSLVFDDDVAVLIGTLLREELSLGSQIIAIDGIALHDYDFIDISRIINPSHTVSVTIKSLLFDF